MNFEAWIGREQRSCIGQSNLGRLGIACPAFRIINRGIGDQLFQRLIRIARLRADTDGARRQQSQQEQQRDKRP